MDFPRTARQIARVATRRFSTAPQKRAESTYTGGFNVFDQGRRILVTGGTGQIGTSMDLAPNQIESM